MNMWEDFSYLSHEYVAEEIKELAFTFEVILLRYPL